MRKTNEPQISEEDYLLLRDISVKLREIAKRSNLKSLAVNSSNLNENDKDSFIKFRTENTKGHSVLSDSFSIYQFMSYKEFISNMKFYY